MAKIVSRFAARPCCTSRQRRRQCRLRRAAWRACSFCNAAIDRRSFSRAYYEDISLLPISLTITQPAAELMLRYFALIPGCVDQRVMRCHCRRFTMHIVYARMATTTRDADVSPIVNDISDAPVTYKHDARWLLKSYLEYGAAGCWLHASLSPTEPSAGRYHVLCAAILRRFRAKRYEACPLEHRLSSHIIQHAIAQRSASPLRQNIVISAWPLPLSS